MIKIKDIPAFISPLKALSDSGIESVIFSFKDNMFAVNTKSDDNSQVSNLRWKPSVVFVEDDDKKEKFGVYNLSEFLRTIELFDTKEVTLCITENKMIIKYAGSDSIEIRYILSDIALIKEALDAPKVEPEFLTTLKVDKVFLKKIDKIASSLNSTTIRFSCKDGVLSYAISDKYFHDHSHVVSEIITDKSDSPDFIVYVNIDKFAVLPKDREYELNLSTIIINFDAIENESMEVQRYFIAPQIIGE